MHSNKRKKTEVNPTVSSEKQNRSFFSDCSSAVSVFCAELIIQLLICLKNNIFLCRRYAVTELHCSHILLVYSLEIDTLTSCPIQPPKISRESTFGYDFHQF